MQIVNSFERDVCWACDGEGWLDLWRVCPRCKGSGESDLDKRENEENGGKRSDTEN
jgi:DnaJ-class molecular chaperone